MEFPIVSWWCPERGLRSFLTVSGEYFVVSLWSFSIEFLMVSWMCPERVLRSFLTFPRE